MKKILFLSLIALLFFNKLLAQDTTWVQTFTFDSINSRRANFNFPPELNAQRFEKILMYYKLKCSPLTSWDQYNCGEWDYLTYTRVFDHTGTFDSVRKDSYRYLSNYTNPSTIPYLTFPNNISDNYQRAEYLRNPIPLASSVINNSNSTGAYPFNTAAHGGRFQMLISASELVAAGVPVGDIQSLSLFLNSLGSNGEMMFPNIAIKSTSATSLLSFESSGFTLVYNASHGAGGTFSALTNGLNELMFFQAFPWNGTDNLIVEFSFENDLPAANSLIFETEDITSNTALSFEAKNGVANLNGSTYGLLELSDLVIGDAMTIEFWQKGNGVAGTNTSFLEAYDTLNNRIVNIHMPWSDNNVYFDAGVSSGYDRINKLMAANEIDNTWNHWAFVKNQASGEMFIYKNGALWHSGTGKNRSVGYVHRLVLGANMSNTNIWKGSVDEFKIYNAALSAATIQNNYLKKTDSNHPNWSNLLAYYDFDEVNYAVDRSQNQNKLMFSAPNGGVIQFNELPLAGVQQAQKRPKISFGKGLMPTVYQTNLVVQKKAKEPLVVFQQQAIPNHFDITNSFWVTGSGAINNYDAQGALTTSLPYATNQDLFNDTISYYNTPYEIVRDVEIARYITPYGINFDLGPNGFSWIYDVTDYQQYLKNTVDLAAHNTQELLDLRFAFIQGIPPRDLHKREPIWSDFRSYNYGNMSNDVVLQATPVVLSDTSSMFKIKTRMSGHGQVGNGACCEWVPNDHQIKIDGVPRFNWNLWQTTDCGDNPNIGQGGTWPYAREGWCPGDKVKEHEFELTPHVSPGDTVMIDYSVNAAPIDDQGQTGGNYIAAYDLISYSAPNHQVDAAILEVLNPNNWEYYSKYNPTCSNPRVILKNTGAQALTSCKIRCWVTYGVEIEYDWTGNLAFLEEEMVEIPVTYDEFWMDQDSNKTFTAYVCNVNGGSGNDEYNQNSVKQTKFDAPERIAGPFYVWLTTNNKAVENKYRLIDTDGNILFERNNMSNTTQYKDTFDLAPGCYSIIIEDTDSDGLSFWYSSQVEGETAGQMRLRLVGGSYIEFFPGDFGRYHRYDFSIGFGVGIDENKLDHEIAIFPNPTSGEATIEVSGSVNFDSNLEIYDLMGRKVLAEKMNANAFFAESHVDLSALQKGTYVVKILTNQRVYTKELIKQ